MHLSEIAIRRPVFAWMIMASLLVFGALSFNRLGLSNLPDVDFPVVSVSVSLPGAAPEVIEAQIIDPLEDAIMQIGGIRSINSSSAQSSGSISIEFELDRNIDKAIAEVQNRIAQARNLMPTDMEEPRIRKRNPEDTPIMWVTVTSDSEVPRIERMIFVRDVIFNQLASVPGVGDINLGGYVDPALKVAVDLKKLKQYDLTADDLIKTILSEHIEQPAGRIESQKKEFDLRVLGEADNPKDFGLIPITARTGMGSSNNTLRLHQVATITEATVDERRLSRFNGRDALGMGILKQHGSNAVRVADAVRQKIEEIRPTLPKQYQIEVGSDNTRFVRSAAHELMFLLLASALLTSLVCLLFLGSWTSTLNVLLAIPTSIIGTFMALHFFGFTLNTFTLLGLSLAIGLVVDDAIMMLENIVRHRQIGEQKMNAAIIGAKEISFAAIAATIAVVAIFLPVIFMKGVIGRYFFQFGITVSAAVLLSLLEAITLTPMRCSRYLNIAEHDSRYAKWVDKGFGNLTSFYQRTLETLLNHKIVTIASALILFVASFGIIKLLPSELMPSQDQSQLLIRLKTPVGSSISFTDGKLREAEAYLRSLPESKSIFAVTGGFGGGDAANAAIIFFNLVEPAKRALSQAEIMMQLRKVFKEKLANTKVVVQDLSLRGFASSRGFPIEFILQGPSWKKLRETAEDLTTQLKDKGILADTDMDIEAGMPEVQIIPDKTKMAAHGVEVAKVSQALGALVGGAIMRGTAQYPKEHHRYPIVVKLIPSQYQRIDQLAEVLLRNNRGEIVPLSKLVSMHPSEGVTKITRQDRARSITIYANPGPGYAQQEALKAAESFATTFLPEGYRIKMSGSSQSFRETFVSLIIALMLGILVSYMVLGSQFNSFLHPITVLLALPFSFSGAFLALYLFGQSINMYSLIGLILLMGIVKKNSILLVDYTNVCRTDGLSIRDALLKACPVRLRPILMTSIATIAGALPEALSVGPGSESTRPMAIAIIGGIIASTILTLLVVPCAYALMSRLELKQKTSH